MSFLGFNRYMVECEYHMKLIKGEASLVLIDTWWNVNTPAVLHYAASLSF